MMDAAVGRADYADVRHVTSEAESISTRNGAVDFVRRGTEEGFGVRVRIGGAWGFAAARGTEAAAAERALEWAIAVAEAQPRVPGAGPLAPELPARGSYATALGTNPFDISLEDKLALLLAADEAMRGDPRVTLTMAQFSAFREDKLFANTDGALCDQRIVECGGGIVATATNDSDAQVRSYPGSHREQVAQAGWEHFAGLDLVTHAPRVGEEAVALLSAPQCPASRTTLVLDGEQAALQGHESVGHALELDRVLGREASYAGTSFVDVPDLGSLRYGSEQMNVTADATCPGGLGSFGWDDEGVAGHAFPLVSGGVLRGFLSSREAAAEIGLERSGGCMRANGFARQPIIRMTNINLAPGDAGSLDDLIADTDEGVYMQTNRSWSIDNRRLQFQFATEAAWEIKNGERGQLLRNPSYGCTLAVETTTTRSAGLTSGGLGADECGGRAGAGHVGSHGAAGAVPQRAGRRKAGDRSRTAGAGRVRAGIADADAQATWCANARCSRFAARDHAGHAGRRPTAGPACPRGPHWLADTNATTTACDCRARADAGARRATRRAGRHRALRRRWPHPPASTTHTAAAPASAGSPSVAALRGRRAEASGSGRRRVETAILSSAGASRDASPTIHEGRASETGARLARRRRRLALTGALAARAVQGQPIAEPRPASIPWSSSTTRWARCWTSWAAWPSTAWPTPKGAGRSSDASASAWRRPASTWRTRRASRARCRAPSTPRASQRSRCPSSRMASPTRSSTTRARPPARGRRPRATRSSRGARATVPCPPTSCASAAARPTRPSSWRRSSAASTSRGCGTSTRCTRSPPW